MPLVDPPRPRRRPVAPGPAPGLRVERSLLDAGACRLAGMDEVGRGALSGPVSVGVVVIGSDVRRPPVGLRDSKLLNGAARTALVPRIRRWAAGYGVGHASPAEIDAVGLIAALRLAGQRALAGLAAPCDVVLLDGNHDWLTPPAPDLLDLLDDESETTSPPVVTRIKADLTCAAVAAASVLAKVERDALMCVLSRDHPEYGWDQNKGYASPAHLAALHDLGPCAQHRRSWNLPCQGSAPDEMAAMGQDVRARTSRVEERV